MTHPHYKAVHIVNGREAWGVEHCRLICKTESEQDARIIVDALNKDYIRERIDDNSKREDDEAA